MRSSALLAAAVLAATPAFAQADKHQWLERVEDPAALAWVARENARAVGALRDDRYRRLHDEAFEIASTDRRIPTYEFEGPHLFSWRQNAEHKRGVWRRSTLKTYQRGAPRWDVVVDLDALAKAERANWVWKGADCAGPDYDRCLIRLSDGGKDAVQVREFDLSSRRFAEDGFRLPEGKQAAVWLDADTLLVSRAADGATESGYGYVLKSLKREQAPEQATEVFRGQPTDVSVAPHVLKDGQGNTAVIIERGLDFFRSEYHLLTPEGPKRLRLPERMAIHGFLDGLLIFTLAEDWDHPRGGKVYAAGSLLAYDPTHLVERPQFISNQANLILQPGPRQSIEQVGVTAGRVVAVVNDNVRSKLIAFTNNGEWGWEARELPGGENASILIESVSDLDDKLFYRVEGFVDPTQLKLADAATGKATTSVTMPDQFSARGLVVEQHEATSKDGTRIPYFLIRRKDAPLNGETPTLLHGYGGFQITKAPIYDAFVGKLWLEKGGAYAVANIRGGGEFGPAWHHAALKENRQHAFDDFIAVAEDLVARKVTSPRRLGIYGRSNGGLLVGAAMSQRPDLFNAVVIESPLLDMLRYHELPAG
ncbi:MAG TPA: prolyl oligopeptidase family serine peptidase, partial [Caulobacteraceae bacterium]|nr:prolyl oligopeptidase family serine peptidase [Caulobacteraceae bacterium]